MCSTLPPSLPCPALPCLCFSCVKDKGVRFVDLDLVVQLALEPWRTVRSSWEEHAKFLYQQFCTVHK